MALATWGDIKTGLTNWLARADLVARYPEWCALIEADIRRKLRSPEVISSTTMVVGNRDKTLSSSDIQEIELVRYTDGQAVKGVLTKLSAEALQASARSGSGVPLAYTITSLGPPQLSFDIAPDAAYGITVVSYSFTPLNTAADGNTSSLLTKSPDLYLYGILTQSAPYIEHDERLATWQAFYQNALDGENLAMERLQLGGGAKPISLPVVFG